MKKGISLLLIWLLFIISSFGQYVKKHVDAIPVQDSPKIDGILDEDVWKDAPIAADFIQRQPYNGKPPAFPTEVRFLYDNSGLYVGAMMYDPNPDSIPAQLGLRDSQGLNADYFILMLSPFNDGINAFCFMVYVSDVQSDYKLPGASSDFEQDMSWDAVWQSKARKNKKGWVVEMKIPYSAIRFPKTGIQEWGVNCQRDIRRIRESSSWNFIDSKVQGFVNQGGLLQGIHDIKPPLRLSLSPYVSGYIEKNPDDATWQFSYNYGADLKYGINQSFTLDMTLIPDFGQVPSDDKIYNFSPFEIRYDEKRQFFTEGTELFNKGGIFYSRRIGAEPVDYFMVYDSLGGNEIVKDNPMQTKLLNATKVSGRTNGNLGIGVFNAISGNTWAKVTDTVTGEQRKTLTQGVTNYNMLVFDQGLKNNSWFDLMNTNYYIPGTDYCANVTGTDFKFANKKYTYALNGNGFVSQKYYSHQSPEFGYHYYLEFGKISGNFQFSYSQLLETDTYDPNDMGYNARNNKFDNKISLKYNIYEPFGNFLSWYNNLYFYYDCIYDGFKFSAFRIQGESHINTKKHLDIGLNFETSPLPSHDYYEPRVDDYMYITPAEYSTNIWISTDYRKKIALDVWTGGYMASKYNSYGLAFNIGPRFRASDKLFFTYLLSYENILNNVGYVTNYQDSICMEIIIFGKRDIQTITNVLRANYMINSKMSIDFRLRHYWVTAPYSEYYTLQTDGYLDLSDYNENNDINFNQFNIDFSYIWNFAPGSQLSLVWKNAIATFANAIEYNFFDNISQTIGSPASNSFSIRFLYYLDALYFKKKNTKNRG
jgi:hypothetical protein